MSVGKEEDLIGMEGRLKSKYEIKTKWPGPKAEHNQEVKVLNRIVTWEKNGVGYEADPRHVEVILEQLQLTNCTPVGTPGTSTEGKTQADHGTPLDLQQESRYRALVARANYLSPDRADIAFAVKELAKSMSNPTNGDSARLKRLGRYLAGKPRLQLMFNWQEAQQTVIGYTDADWAGSKETRKSTSGGCLVIGTHLIKGWAKTQSLIALSSAESELYATLRTSAETLGLLAMAKDVGYNLRGIVLGDASAALGIIHRKGLGETRHIDTSFLWVQEVAAQRRLEFSKVVGRENPVDLYTKHLDAATMHSVVEKLMGKYKDGRSRLAPELHSISISWSDYLKEQNGYVLCHLEQRSITILSNVENERRRTQGIRVGQLRAVHEANERKSMYQKGGQDIRERQRPLTQGIGTTSKTTNNTKDTTTEVGTNNSAVKDEKMRNSAATISSRSPMRTLTSQRVTSVARAHKMPGRKDYKVVVKGA